MRDYGRFGESIMTLDKVKRCRECRKEIDSLNDQILNAKSKKQKADLLRQFEKITDKYREEC